MFIVDGMEDKDVSKLKEKIEKVDHVKEVIWYDSIADISMPKSMLPTKVYDAFNSETGTMMAIFLMKEHLRTEQWKQSPRSVLWRASSAF